MSKKQKQVERTIELIARMIPRELRAKDVYTKAASSAPNEMTRILFEHLAAESAKHQTKLQAVLKMLRDELKHAPK